MGAACHAPAVGAGLGDTRRTSPPATNAGALSLSHRRRWKKTQGFRPATNAATGAQTPYFVYFSWLIPVPQRSVHGSIYTEHARTHSTHPCAHDRTCVIRSLARTGMHDAVGLQQTGRDQLRSCRQRPGTTRRAPRRTRLVHRRSARTHTHPTDTPVVV